MCILCESVATVASCPRILEALGFGESGELDESVG